MLSFPRRASRCMDGVLTHLCQRSVQLTPRYPELEIPKYSKDEDHISLILNSIRMDMMEKAKNLLGYQVSQSYPELDPNLTKMMQIHMNNVGDPFIETTYRLSCKGIERAIMDYYADLWHKNIRNDLTPNDPENYWGYVLNMGSTEGNLDAIWFAREYFKPLTRKKPIVLSSEHVHYSLNKACEVLSVKHDSITTNHYAQMDNEALLEKVKYYVIQEGRPIVAVFTSGTTFTGAYDRWETVIGEIEKICTEHGVPYWFHLDGALGGFVVPFLERGIRNGTIEPESDAVVPSFGFHYNIQSCCASFHKWYGAPYPSGIFMTSNKYLRQRQTPEYIASPDTTMGGSRNAYTALYMWWRLSLSDYANEIRDVKKCTEHSQYLYDKLSALDIEIGRKVVEPSRAPYSLSVTFNSPSPYICNKYSVPYQAGRSHIFTMRHVTKQTIDQFVDDFRRQLMADGVIKDKSHSASSTEDVEYCIFDGTIQTATVEQAVALTTDAFTTRNEPVAHHLSARDFELFVQSYCRRGSDLETSPMIRVNGELVGICLNNDFASCEREDEELMRSLLMINYFGYSIIYQIMSDLDQPFKSAMEEEGLMQPGNILHIWIPAVESRFGRRGICGDLMRRSIDIARNKGYKMVIAECTNDYSIKAAKKCGMECYNKVRYDEWEYPKGSGIYPYEAIETVTGFKELCLMVLRL